MGNLLSGFKGTRQIPPASANVRLQWQYIFGFSSTIGGIFNNVLEDNNKNTIFQEEEPLIFHSERQVIDSLDRGNLAQWLFDSFIFTPNYPYELNDLEFCTECKKYSSCRDCLFSNENVSNKGKLPEYVDKKQFVRSFWEIINTT